MRISDQHIHSSCSQDSRTPMRVMAEAARDAGMHMVCFTDHIEMNDPYTGRVDPNWADRWPVMLEARKELAADPPPGIEVRLGMELGAPNHLPELAAQAAAAPELDLVIGSLHNLRNVEDFYFYKYADEADCARLNRAYLAELLEIAALPCFDVMAHVGYTVRYMSKAGFSRPIGPEEYGEELTAIFRTLIRNGRGIEVNTSGLRQLGYTYPNAEILSLYRSLGGEIVTVGSDGHRPEDAGAGILEARELLRTLGFRYCTEFKKRKPEFLPL